MRKIFTLVLILLSIFFANAQEEPTAYVYPNEVYFPETQVGTAYETKVHIQLGSGFTDGYFYADLGGPVPCPFSYKYSWEDEFRPVDVGGWGYCCAYEGMSYELIIRFAPTEEGDFTGSLSLYAYTQNGEYVNIGYIPLSGSATQNPAAGVIPMSMDSITNIGMNAATANFTVNTAGLNSSYSYVNISDYSIVWGTSVNPAATSANTQIFYDQNGSVSSAGIENLTPGTTYYVRGTVDYNYTYTYQDPYYNWYQTTYDYYMTYYSNEVSFTTADTNAVTQPTVTTGAASSITATTATCGGEVTANGGATVTERGVCWSTSQNPTVDGSHQTVGIGIGSFAGSITGLTPTTTYYVRAYATNSEGTAYGEEVTFTTAAPYGQPCPGTPTVTDHEGNVYNTVQIGEQCWTRENLRTTTSPTTGTYLIPIVGTTYTYTGKQARWYNNDSATYAPMNYGLLYNWNAAADTFNTAYGETNVNTSYSNAVAVTFNGNRRGICPVGWHLPSEEEWTALKDYMRSQSEYVCGNSNFYIDKALADNAGWYYSSNDCAVGNDLSANNASGFSAVPAGKHIPSSPSFNSVGGSTYFWGSSQKSSSRAYSHVLYYSSGSIAGSNSAKCDGYSVRCLRNENTASTLATVTTGTVSDIAVTAATCGGNVTADGGATVTERGVCWSTSQTPTVADAHTSDGTGTGTFTSSITNLTSNTTYYVRAYATNSEGTAYGEEVTFTTAEESTPSTFTCGNNLIVGNYSYTTNQYGSQCWMTQNMRNASGSVGDTYYQDVLQACPTGWHLPDDSEWSSLGNYLINNENVPSFGDGEYWTSTTMLWEDNDGNQFTLISPPIVQSNNITYNGVSCEIHDYGHDCFALSTSPHIAYVRCLRNDNVIGSGDATNTYLPSYSYYKYSLTQQIYTAEEIGTAGTINSIAFKNASAEKTRTYNMYFLHTDKETFENNTDWVAMSSDDLVFSGELTFTVGEWTTITLDEPFVYDGSSNLLVGVADVTGSYTSSPHMACLVFDAPSQSIRVYRDSPGAYDIASPGVNGTIQNVKNQIKLGITPIEGSVCERPTSIAVSDITLNSATVSWTGEGSAFNLQYKISDDTDWTEVNGLSEFSYDLTGLAPFTTYRVRVQQVCAESASGWKTATFTTPACSPADQCELTFVLADGYGDGWNGCAINVVDAETGSIYGSCTIEGGSSATHQVTVCNGRNVNFVWVNGNYPDETSWVIYDVNDEEVTSGAGNSSMATGDVLETYTVSCAANPCRKPTNLFVSSTGITSVDLTWNENGSSTAWQLCLNGDTTNLVTADANPFTLTGLIPETTYTAKVRANCGDDGVSNWSPSVSFTTAPCPAPVTKDTAVCASELPLTWHGHTFEEFESFTDTLTTADGCDSIVTLRVRNLSYYNILLSDDFNDGVIDPEKWTYTGNAVVEEDGQLKLYQNVTDQDVHLRSVDLSVPANGKVTMDRKFRVHRSDNSTYGNYFYGNSRFYLNGGDNYVGLQYNYTTYEGWYGTYLIYNVNGNENRVRLCDATFDTWLTEQVEIDFFAGTLSYYLDTLVATMDIPGLSTQTVDYFNVFFNPGGWWTGHQHFLDYVDIHGGIGAVRTAPASDVTYTSATCGGEVAPNECDAYTATGVCWSTSHNPSLDGAHTTDGTGAGTFTSELTNLTEGTTYYVRAYAVNSTDTVYGQEVNFTTCKHFSTEFEDAICENALPYVWNEVPYSGSGDYDQSFQTAAGCDSVATLHLTVLSEPTVTITGPTTVGPGKSITLTASGADIYSWSANGAIISNNDSITVYPQETTTFSVTGYMERRNLVVNSDFEQGNTGFTTNYSYVNDGSWGHYYIGHDNHEMWSWDPATNVITDHTTGNGLWMMVDAYPNRNIWSQTVEVTPNTDYAFSAWFVTNNIANVRFEINGQQGEIFTTPQQQGVWEKRQFVWNSGNNTSANLKITTGSASSSGNDFGIDDISFSELICENTASTTVAICPLPVTLDTTVCPSELPLTWHNQTFEDYGTQTFTLQTATGCDSVVTLIVKTPFSLLSDDFNDGVIDLEKWTYTGNAVIEEDGQLKLQQNVTDQDVHLRSVDLDAPADGKVAMDRKFMVHRNGQYYYGSAVFYLNGDNNSYINLEYTYAQYYDGAYHYNDPRNGIYVNSRVGGTEASVRLCDVAFDTWLTEHVELDFVAGTLSYYIDTLVATIDIPGLSSQTVESFCVQYHPYGWWTGHQHYMDYVDIRGGMGAVRTSPVSDVAYTTATCGGEVASNECDAYTAVGVCWSTSLNPTLNDAHTTDGTGAGTFTSELTNLAEGTTYYVRAYATNNTDTVYGPTVSFTTCRHFTSEFEVTICENALPYIWNEVPYNGSGDYDQTFQTAAGCDSVVTLHLTVLPPPTVEIFRAAESSATICEGSSTTLEAVVTGGYGGYTSFYWYQNGNRLYEWDNHSRMTIGNLAPGVADLYTFEVAQTGDGCYNSASAALDTMVTVYPQFTVSASAPATVCDNGTLTLTATMENASADDELSFQWYKIIEGSPTAFPIANTETYTETALYAGPYSYWVEVYGTVSGCSAASEMGTVTILPTYHTTLYDTICQGYEYDFFGEPLTESGPYTHTLQANNGCDSVITLHLTVLPKPSVEIARAAGYAAAVCEGTATAIEAVVTGGYGEIVSYQWYKNDNVLPNETNTVLNIDNLTVGADDLYTFEVAQTGNGCSNTASVALNTLVTVYPQFTVSVSGPASICDNGTLTLTATVDNASDNDVLTYQWYQITDGVANAIEGANAATYTSTNMQNGSYDYQLEVHGSVSGCNAVSVPFQVNVLPAYSTTLYDTICYGVDYEFFGEPLTQSGTYSHTMQAVNGCDSVITLHLTVEPLPTVTITGPTNVDFGTSVTLTAEGAVNYEWSSNGVVIGSDATLTDTPEETTTYSVVGTAQNGCTGTASVEVTVNPQLILPELHVTSITHSDFVGGEPVTISWTVQNDGTAPTPNGAVWYDRVWLSLETRVAAGDNNPIFLGEFPNVSALNPGEYYTQTQTFDIPLSLAGSYFLFVITDAYDAHHIYWDDEVPIPYNPPAYIGALSAHCTGGDCGNGAGNKILEISEASMSADYYPSYHDNFFYELVDIAIPPLPDLKVSDIYPPTQNFYSGTDIDFSYQVINDGNYDTRVANWTDLVFVSNSPVFDENAQLIKSIPHQGLLMPGSSYQVSTTVSIPIVMMGTAWFYVYTDYYNQVYEHVGRYNNVSRSDEVNIFLAPPADLVPQNITADHTVSTGATFTFSYEVHNTGAGDPNNGTWLDRCYLSTSATSLENAVLLAENMHYNGLASEDFYSVTRTMALPSSMTEGTYYLFVHTDAENSVFEYDRDGNNLACSEQPVLVVMPDLQIHVLNTEDTLHAAAEEGISYFISNMSDGAAINQTVMDRVYLSSNADGSGAIQIGEISHNIWLNSHDSLQKMQNVAIPGDLQDGNYYIFVSTNATQSLNELDLTNNTSPLKKVYILHLSLPDLVISSVGMPDTVTAGDTAALSIQLRNQGEVPANIGNLSWQLKVTVGGQTQGCAIGSWNADAQTLAVGATATVQMKALIPPLTTLDSASFELTVNPSHGVVEAVYSNNSYGIARVVRPYPFDLAVTELSSPAETLSGDSITVSWTVENIGASPSDNWPMYVRNGASYQLVQGEQLPSPWYDVVYLSRDGQLDEADVEIGRYEYPNVLRSGSDYSASMKCRIPLAAGGDYYVLVVSDATNVTFDCQPANNVRVQPLAVTPSALPDLQIDELLASDVIVTLTSYKIYYTVSNRGEHITHNDSWKDVLYLNSQPTIEGARLLGTKVHNGQLDINATYTDSIQVSIPHIAAGDYYLIGYTDKEDQTVETNNDNNLFALPVSLIHCALPDLWMDTIEVSAAVTTGDSYKVRYTVSNGGEYVTRTDRWTDALYLNDQPSMEGAQHIGSKVHIGVLDINNHYTDSIQVTIPNIAAGDYYLIGYTDATNQVLEVDGDVTNLFILPVTVSRPLPCDLTVLPPDFPTTANIGENVEVSWPLQNIGLNTAYGNIKDAVYLSTDSTWSSDDIMLGSMTYAVNLAASTQEQRSATLTLQGVPAGDYYVVVKTNILNALNEDSYTNNKAVSLMTMHVDYPSLYIGQEEQRELSSGQSAYYKLEVGPEYENQTLSCKLTTAAQNISNGLYIAYSSAPTASNFNFSATLPYVQEQEILIPSLEQGTYYIMVTGQTSDNSTQNVTILASIINFEILSVDANSGSNTGSVTTQIIGAKFDTIMDFRLANSNGYLPAEKVFFSNSTESFVTFNLRDQETGVYDVVAELPGGIITVKDQAFVIEEGLPAELLSNIIAPASVRYGNTFTVTVEYGNIGSTDLDVAGILLVSTDEFPIAFTTEGLAYNAYGLIFETAEPNGNPDVIRPGYFASKTIFVKAVRTGNINLKVYPIRRQY